MAKIVVKNGSGAPAGELELKSEVFEVQLSIPLMHQAVVAEEANQRRGTSETKTRSEVSGGGAKPFRQKGTGRARQGSTRAPHMTHGGVVFGPHMRSYEKKMPKKMRRAAMRSALTAKLNDGDIIVVESLALEEISTKAILAILTSLGAPVDGRILVVVDEMTDVVKKSIRNLDNVSLKVSPAISVRDVLVAHKTIMTKKAIDVLQGALA